MSSHLKRNQSVSGTVLSVPHRSAGKNGEINMADRKIELISEVLQGILAIFFLTLV